MPCSRGISKGKVQLMLITIRSWEVNLQIDLFQKDHER